MDGKTLLLMLIGGGIAAYLAYSLTKSAQSAQPSGENGMGGDAETGGDAGTGLDFGLSNNALCRVAPELCNPVLKLDSSFPVLKPAPTLW
jgi:hypothetical protein